MQTVALIVAAGRGTRAGGSTPKQYQLLAGQPLLSHSISAFVGHQQINAVRVVIHPDDHALYDRAAAGFSLLPPVHGGATRQDSVLRGLESLATTAPARVLIHDAARALIPTDVISRTIAALAEHPGAIAAVPLSDTLKRGDPSGAVAATVERAGLWRAQTPQSFHFEAILAAHRAAAGLELTDDAAVAEHAGIAVALVAGSEDNLKVTTVEDWARAEALLAARRGPDDIRVGSGFDVHRFCPGDHVMLCGVRVPFEHGLEGHSDADVPLHAITDAILGAIGAGDIGTYFPASDPRWRNADSALFARYAIERLREFGGALTAIDVTVIAEAPRIGPHRETMVVRLAAILDIPKDRVNVKATTTEGLGFTGRREGVAAQATATVRLPRRAE